MHVATEAKALRSQDEPALLNPADPVFGEILNFLNLEAGLLDEDLHERWLGLMADDIVYRVPIRETRYRKDGRGFDTRSFHFDDDRQTLGLRVKRSVGIASAFDRDPAPRIRRFVSNVLAHETERPGEYQVASYLMLTRNRFDQPQYEMITARREDLIRRTPAGLRLARRLVLLDQSALGGPYLNVLL